MDEKLFDELLKSVEEMDEIRRGKKRASRRTALEEIKVAEVRRHTGLSQTRFARLIGVTKRTLENWEQGGVLRPGRRVRCSRSWPKIPRVQYAHYTAKVAVCTPPR